MRLEEGLELVSSRVGIACGVEEVAVTEAQGRILAYDVTAIDNVPPHTNSAVDGYAFYHSDLGPEGETELEVQGRVPAGHPFSGQAKRRRAFRVFTGAMIPGGEGDTGPDTVIMQEDCRSVGDRVWVPSGVPKGANVRPLGEDVSAGATVLKAGRKITAIDQALMTSVGVREVGTYARLKVALFSTGDEVCEPGSELGPGQIYDSNRIVLLGFLKAMGCLVTDLGILPDKIEECRKAIGLAAQSHDLLLSSGGVSVGEEDHIRAAIQQIGQISLWRLAIKPGRPLALATINLADRVVPYLGLPGNPVAVIVTFMQFGRALIMRLAGRKGLTPRLYPVIAGFSYHKKPNRREYLRCILTHDADGQLVAHLAGKQGAGILSAIAAADGLLELPEEMEYLGVGSVVQFLPFGEFG